MFKNSLKGKMLLAGSVMSMLLAGCQEDLDVNNKNNWTEVNYQQVDLDVVKDALVHKLSSDAGAPQRMELNTLDDIIFETSENSPITLRAVKEGDKQYAEIEITPAYQGKHFVESVLIAPKNAPGAGRHIFIAGRPTLSGASSKVRSATDPGDPMLSVYSDHIGQSTYAFAQQGSKITSILDYSTLCDLDATYVVVTSTDPDIAMSEKSGLDSGSMMEQFSLDLGVDFKKVKKTATGFSLTKGPGGLFSKIVPNKPKVTSISGTVNFGMSGSVATSYDYEYYYNYFTVGRSEIQVRMNLFELSENNQRPDTMLLLLIDDKFVDQLKNANPDTFNYEQFLTEWGTDVVTQATFGGYCLYYYGRKENTYETSLDIDASAEMKVSHPSSEGKDWIDVYKDNHSPYFSSSVDLTYMNSKYRSASDTQSNYICLGGNMTNDDADKWLDSFNTNENSQNWALISYRTKASSSLADSDSNWNLYPIDQMGKNLLDMFVAYNLNKLTHRDSLVMNRMTHLIDSLSTERIKFIEKNANAMTDRTKLVVADFKMINGSNGHKKGEPTSKVLEDPRETGKYRIYYPIMANKYNHYSKDEGYALETTQNAYYNGALDNQDHYWYYALGHEDDCEGIVDVQFLDKTPEFYVRRGDSSDPGGLVVTNNYVCVRYFDKGVHDPSQKITAIGLYRKHKGDFDPCRVIGSTGGSELRWHYNETEYNAWFNWWNTGASYVETQWNEGAMTTDEPLWPCISRKDLDINRIKSGICHPLPW